jgi:hypothetical protein
LHKIVVCGSRGGVLNSLRVLEAVRANYCYAGVFPQLVNMFLVLEIVIDRIIEFKPGFKVFFRSLLRRWVILLTSSLEIRCRRVSTFCSAVLPHLAAKMMNRAIKFG